MRCCICVSGTSQRSCCACGSPSPQEKFKAEGASKYDETQAQTPVGQLPYFMTKQIKVPNSTNEHIQLKNT